MKLLFNDMSELVIQEIRPEGDYLTVKTISAGPTELRSIFEDETKTRCMKVVSERGTVMQTYEGFTDFYRTEEYTGGIFGVTNYKPDRTPEAKADLIESSVKVARIQAQNLNDEAALTVQNLYPEWSSDAVPYTVGYKVQQRGILYRCLQEHISQADWSPEVSASIWAKVLNPDPEVIPEWEQPESTNGYSAGDKVLHNEKTWESLVDNNIWEPGAPGSEALWKELTDESNNS